VAARSKAWDCGRSPAEIMGLNPAGGHGCLSVVNVVEVSASGCGVSECDHESSTMSRLCLNGVVAPW